MTNKELIKHLRQLGKYSEFEPNYFLLAADRIEELEQNQTDKKLQRAIKMLKAEYERAKLLKFVNNPLAYALYQVWKIEDTKR